MRRIEVLDGIRGLAILLVLIWHFFGGLAAFDNSGSIPWAQRILNITWSGVDLFFVLSGFLIVGILLDAKQSSGFIKTFFIRRFFRIAPLYFLMVLTFLAITKLEFGSDPGLFAKPYPIWSYLTFTQNFFIHGQSFGPNWLGVTWSLAVEEQFYLVIPFLILLLDRKKLLFVFFACICFAPLFRLYVGGHEAYVLPFCRADALLIGGCLAIFIRHDPARIFFTDHSKYIISLFLVLFAGTIFLALLKPRIGDVFTHSWLALFYGVLLLAVLLSDSRILRAAFSNKILVWLGLRSYGIYLFHLPVRDLVRIYFGDHEGALAARCPEPAALLIALATVVILAEISFQFFESVFIRIGQKYQYRTPERTSLP